MLNSLAGAVAARQLARASAGSWCWPGVRARRVATNASARWRSSPSRCAPTTASAAPRPTASPTTPEPPPEPLPTPRAASASTAASVTSSQPRPRWDAGVPAVQGHGRRQVAPRGRAADGDAGGVDAQLCGVLAHPEVGGVAVVVRNGVVDAALAQPVVDRDRDVSTAGQLHAVLLELCLRTGGEAAPVHEDHDAPAHGGVAVAFVDVRSERHGGAVPSQRRRERDVVGHVNGVEDRVDVPERGVAGCCRGWCQR